MRRMTPRLQSSLPAVALCLVACASRAPSPPTAPAATTAKALSWARAISRGTVTAFDPAGNLVSGGANQEREGVLTKFSPTGDSLWTVRLTSTALLDISAVSADAAGNFYVAGAFERRLDVAEKVLAGGERPSIFLAKLGPDGTVVWAKAFSGEGYNAARGIAADPDGTLYVTGTYQHELSFGGEKLQAYVFRDVFVASFDTSGAHRWSMGFHVPGPLDTSGTAIATSDKMVYVAGLVESDLTFAELSGHVAVQPAALFVVAMSREGRLVFRKIATGPGTSRATAIATDGTHGITVVGQFDGSMNVEGNVLKSSGQTDGLVVHYDQTGAFSWSKRFGGVEWDRATGVAMGPDGTSYVTADVMDGIDLGDPDTGRGGHDAVLAAFDPRGTLSWMRRYGGEGDDVALSVARSRTAALAISGSFTHFIEAGVGSLAAGSTSNGFVLRFADGTPPVVNAPAAVIATDRPTATKQAVAAAERGDVDTLKRIVPEIVNANATDSHGWPLVMKAAYKGKADAIRYLCAHGASPDAALPSGYTALMQAVRWGYVDAAKALVEAGANVGASDSTAGTALHVAVHDAKEAIELVGFLTSQKAPVEAKDAKGRTPLLVALDAGNGPAAMLLLDAGALAKTADERGYSALGRAATAENLPLVNALLAHGADPNIATDRGLTSVADAAQNGNVAILAALLAHGGDPNGPSSEKPVMRPITLAAEGGHAETVELLLSKGARVNQVDDKGWTAAHHAAHNAKLNVLKVLKKHKADFTSKDSKGQTAVDVARAGDAKDFVSGKTR